MSLHHYTGALLENIWLENGFTTHETKFGKGVSYTDIEGLFQAIALELCLSPALLSPKAVRFLRKRLDMTQQELGQKLGCTEQAVAKWEKGETLIPVASARLLRILVLEYFVPELPLSLAVKPYGEPSPEKMTFCYIEHYGWQGETLMRTLMQLLMFKQLYPPKPLIQFSYRLGAVNLGETVTSFKK